MPRSIEEIEADALELPSSEREHLAHRLLASVDREDDADDPAEIEQAWNEEIRRRLEEHRSGDVPGIPAEEVLAELRARLA